jgi:outer membrane immunogenic protein
MLIAVDRKAHSFECGDGRNRTMSKLSFLASVLALVGLSAQAADLPLAKEPPPFAPAPAFTWTGFHIGYNQGYGGAVFDTTVALAVPAPGGGAIRTFDQANGWFGGGQIGYDHQFGSGLVLGLETDLQWSDIKSSHQAATATSNPVAGNYANTSQSLGWFGTTRARLGYSLGRLLPYLTGGLGYGGTSANGVQLLPGGGIVVGNASSTNVGWAAGAGLDIALSDRLSARAEYLYLRLPGVSGPAAGLTPIPQQALLGGFSTGATDAYAIRTGMNYRFGGLNDLEPRMDGGLLAFLFQKADVDWSGFHIGVNGGYGGGVVNSVAAVVQPSLALTTYSSNRFGGGLAGGQVGYDHQFANQIVAGLETDLQWSGIQSWHQGTAAGGFTSNGFVYSDNTNAISWFGTTRARLGYARASTLLYVTAGVAYGGLTANVEQLSGALFTGASGKSQAGWTIGSGAEYSLTDKMSLKAEYLYTSFNGINGPAAGIAPAPFPGLLATGRFATQITRVGLNWRFGGGPTPASVVPRY